MRHRSADYSAHLAVAQVSAPALPFIFPALRIELRLWCWNAVWLLAWGSCYGFCALDDCCLCCRLVGTSRMTVFVKTPARASCATNPTCTSWFQILMENTTSGLPVSRNVHVRMELSQLNIPSTSQGLNSWVALNSWVERQVKRCLQFLPITNSIKNQQWNAPSVLGHAW